MAVICPHAPAQKGETTMLWRQELHFLQKASKERGMLSVKPFSLH